ncbi:MAG: protoporphyrinogen oxidase, partial [Verrucomicrobiota bacterium]
MPKFCVIGAGITGLAKAWRLHQEGHEVTVLESSAKVGGAMCSYRQDGYLCEEGPNSIQINSHAVEAFFQSIPGLKEAMIEAQPEAKKRFIVRDGQLHALPTSPLAVISSPIWSLRGKLSALKEPFVKAAPSDSEQSVADFVRRRLGEELYKYAINPLIGGIYAGNPEKLSLRYAFPRLHELEQMHGGLIRGAIAKKKEAKKGDEPKVRKRIVTFKEGIDTLPRLIAAALGNQVHKRTTISSIRQKDEQWQVSWKSEASRSELFDQLILTVPAYA